MRPMPSLRAAAIAVVLAGAILGSAGPASAGFATPEDSAALEAAGSVRAGEGRADERRGATLSVNVAIMALGGLWLVLMARRIQLRGVADGGGMLSSAAPRHAAGGR